MGLTLYDLKMNQAGWLPLGPCGNSMEIRTDGKELFFISTGEGQLHTVRLDGTYRTIHLKEKSDCIAILDNQRLAISKMRSSIELINY